ncbi:unnamed protein product [Schistosoma turkestanicum]|nr:unnamed protein product [Schistosoma turkestanicum]
MFIEGLYLCLIVYCAFWIEKMKFWPYALFGWGLPAILITIRTIMNYIRHPTEFWLFYGTDVYLLTIPSLILLGLNVIFLIIILYALNNKLRKRAITTSIDANNMNSNNENNCDMELQKYNRRMSTYAFIHSYENYPIIGNDSLVQQQQPLENMKDYRTGLMSFTNKQRTNTNNNNNDCYYFNPRQRKSLSFHKKPDSNLNAKDTINKISEEEVVAVHQDTTNNEQNNSINSIVNIDNKSGVNCLPKSQPKRRFRSLPNTRLSLSDSSNCDQQSFFHKTGRSASYRSSQLSDISRFELSGTTRVRLAKLIGRISGREFVKTVKASLTLMPLLGIPEIIFITPYHPYLKPGFDIINAFLTSTQVIFNNFCNELDQLRILCTWNKSEKTTDQSNSSGVLMLRTVLNGEYHCFELSLCAQLRPDLCTLRLNHSTVDNFDSLSCSSAYSSSFSASSSLRSSSSCCSLSNSSSVTGEKNDRDRLTYLSINLIKMSTIKSSSSTSCLLTPVSSSSIISSSGSSSTLLPPNIDSLKLAEKSTKSTFRTIGIVLRDVCIGLDVENSTISNEQFFTCQILQSYRRNTSCYRLMHIQWPESQVNIRVPIGFYVNVRLKTDQGNYVIRPYTPIICNDFTSASIMNTHDAQNNVNKFYLLIKIYPNGEFSQLVNHCCANDTIEVSLPIGNFNNNLIKQIIHRDTHNNNNNNIGQFDDASTLSHIIMLAGGSGITPMLQIIQSLFLNNHQNLQTFKVYLLHFNRCQYDQILISYFDALHNTFPNRFSITHVLSEPLCLTDGVDANDDDNSSSSNHLLYGHLTDELCRQCFNNEIIDQFQSQTYCFICGPSGFNETAVKLTNQWSIPKEHVHVFKG